MIIIFFFQITKRQQVSIQEHRSDKNVSSNPRPDTKRQRFSLLLHEWEEGKEGEPHNSHPALEVIPLVASPSLYVSIFSGNSLVKWKKKEGCLTQSYSIHFKWHTNHLFMWINMHVVPTWKIGGKCTWFHFSPPFSFSNQGRIHKWVTRFELHLGFSAICGFVTWKFVF